MLLVKTSPMGTKDQHPRHLLVVEDEALLRDLIARTLEAEGFVVTTVSNAADAKRAVKTVDPDAMVVDIELGPGPNGLDLAQALTRTRPDIGVVFLTNLPDPRFASSDSKVSKNQAYLRKSGLESSTNLLDAIESVLRDRVTKEYRHDLASSRPFSNLSARQIDTLKLVSQGKTNRQIAEIRGTTERAVESMLSRVFEALEIDPKASNARVEAAARFEKSKG